MPLKKIEGGTQNIKSEDLKGFVGHHIYTVFN